MKSRQLIVAVIVGSLIVVTAAIFLSEDSENAGAQNSRLARLSTLTLPADGLPLYRTLLREIPDIVSEVPCACCGEKLAWCYQGGCPPT